MKTAAKLRNKFVTAKEKARTIVLKGQNNGSDEQALGALMRIDLAIVGAILSMVTGVFICSALVPAPKIMMGNCVNEARES